MKESNWAILQARNLYVFGINNPVMFVDPSGLRIEIVGSIDDAIEILYYLNMLTVDLLDFVSNRQETRHTVTYTAMDSSYFPIGTQLIRDLINHSARIQIELTTNSSRIEARPGAHVRERGSNSEIFFNPNQIAYTYVDNGFGSYVRAERACAHVILAHELIHGLRYAHGFGQGEARREFRFIDPLGDLRSRSILVEELQTIGISNFGDSDRVRTMHGVNENAIRREHGLPRRISFTPANQQAREDARIAFNDRYNF